MKHKLPLIALLFMLVAGLQAQVLTTTEPMPKNAILEVYTGIHCTYCPDGDAIAASILAANPGRAFAIDIHQGTYSVPSAGEPDYRTAFGDALAGQTALTGYPSGTVNRHVFSGSSTALSRSVWSADCDLIMQETSPVNIGLSSEYNESTRTLTIQVELYYTSSSTASSNFINVALIQDSVYGPQTGGGAGNNYLHQHMLRHLITGQWGDEVTTTTLGSLVQRTYTYVVPDSYNNVAAVVEHMKVVGFVTRDHQEIYTGDEVDAIGGTNLYIGNLSSTEDYIKNSPEGVENIFQLQANSNIEGTALFDFTLESENAPSDWTATFFIDGVEYTNTAQAELTKNAPKDIQVVVQAGATPAFPGFVLKMKSTNNPTAPEKLYRVMVISGVTDLVVNGTGGPESSANQGVYLDGLAASGINSYAVTDANVMRDMITMNAFAEVNTCWLNIAWTFPALTDSQAEAVMAFMDAGHSIFIGGQDIGWDIMSGASGSNGNAITQNFYTNYLNAIFVADGSTANSLLIANAADPVYGSVAQSSVVDVYGGNMYPEEINAGAGADIIFNYNTTAKHAAIKYDAAAYRSVYFGVGLEMVSNIAVRNTIIDLTQEWLAAEMTGVEYQAAMNTLMSGQNYPNPAVDFTFIPVSSEARNGRIEVYSLNGSLVYTQSTGNSLTVRLNTTALESGVYTYRVVAGEKVSKTLKLTVIK